MKANGRERKKSGSTRLLLTFIFSTLLAIYFLLVIYAISFSNKQHTEGGALPSSPAVSSGTTTKKNSNPSLLAAGEYNKNHRALDCSTMLQDFLSGKIAEVEVEQGFGKSYITRTTTQKPFYLATHDAILDKVRAMAFWKGFYYERALSNAISDVFDKKAGQGGDTIFLDVGGNIGWFSLLAKAHGASRAYVFEPYPPNIVRICESLTLNDWKDSVDLMMTGVGDEIGTMPFYKTQNSNPGSFSFDTRKAAKFYGEKVKEEIAIVTLDVFAEEMGWFDNKTSIAFFKLDVEGFEPRIIKGAQKLFKSGIIELFAMEMKSHTPEDTRMMIKLFFESGYELYRHGSWKGPKHIVVEKYEKWEDFADVIIHGKKYGENLLFHRVADREVKE